MEDGILLSEKSESFTVTQEYVPPFQPVSITLSPGSAAVLASAEGKVSISFPAGAVLETVKLTLKPVLPNEVPRAQPGVTPAITAFSVDGLAGLLSKDATITVKYSPEDLEAAKGDATKLKLARWDKAENKWVVLPTTLDRSAGTLTVTTNRLSVWAMVVSEGAVPGETRTEGFTALIACGALAMIFIASRLRRR